MGRVFPNTGGKNESVKPTEDRRVRADKLDDVIDEIVDRLSCFGTVRLSWSYAHVATHAGDTKQARLLECEKRLHGCRIHPVSFQQVQHKSRIDRTDAG